MHVEGAKLLVRLRGGINAVNTASRLTARMVAWQVSHLPKLKLTLMTFPNRVSMILTGKPQFETQDDFGRGHGIPPIPEWCMGMTTIAVSMTELRIDDMIIEKEVQNVFNRLRNIFQSARQSPLAPTRLHELTSFAIHRLLSSSDANSPPSPGNECVRLGTILYMFTMQGQAYFPHTVMVNDIAKRFHRSLVSLENTPYRSDSLEIWCVSIGMVVSTVACEKEWFLGRARGWAESLPLAC